MLDFPQSCFRQVFETMIGLSTYSSEGYCGGEKFPESEKS